MSETEESGSVDAKSEGEARKPGPQQIRQQQKHEERLQDIQEQVADGRLVIRQMTPEERKRFPPRPRPEGGRGKRR